jgi:hypothetical protein
MSCPAGSRPAQKLSSTRSWSVVSAATAEVLFVWGNPEFLSSPSCWLDSPRAIRSRGRRRRRLLPRTDYSYPARLWITGPRTRLPLLVGDDAEPRACRLRLEDRGGLPGEVKARLRASLAPDGRITTYQGGIAHFRRRSRGRRHLENSPSGGLGDPPTKTWGPEPCNLGGFVRVVDGIGAQTRARLRTVPFPRPSRRERYEA